MEEHDCEAHDTRERFDAVLKEFLSEKIEAPHNGGYLAPVSQENRDQLHELIHLLILLKWEEDCDGDLPIRYKTNVMKEHLPDSIRQFTISRDPEKDGGLIRWLGRLVSNVRMATDALDREVQCLGDRKITIEIGEEGDE